MKINPGEKEIGIMCTSTIYFLGLFFAYINYEGPKKIYLDTIPHDKSFIQTFYGAKVFSQSGCNVKTF